MFTRRLRLLFLTVLLLYPPFIAHAGAEMPSEAGVGDRDLGSVAKWMTDPPRAWGNYGIATSALAELVRSVLEDDPEIGLDVIKEEHDYKNTPEIWYAFRCRPKKYPGAHKGGFPLLFFGWIGGNQYEEFTQVMVRIYQKVGSAGNYDIITRSVERFKPGWDLDEVPEAASAIAIARRIRQKIKAKLQAFDREKVSASPSEERPADTSKEVKDYKQQIP